MTSNSPKRKRESSEDSDRLSLSPRSPSTGSVPSLPELKLRDEEDLGRYSPRAIVAGRLGQLAIRGEHFPTPSITATTSAIDQTPVAQSVQAKCWPPPTTNLSMVPATDPRADTSRGEPPQSTLACQSEQVTSVLATDSHVSTATKPPSPEKTTPSPRKKRNLQPTSRSRGGKRSPPLATTESEDPLTWHDSEITGHNTTDPNDDGTGINGIGFKPTAAMAWARSQKRQKQMAEWKSREARDARERRKERREGIDLDRIHTVQKGAIQKRVKFDV